MPTRRALVIGLAGFIAACAGPPTTNPGNPPTTSPQPATTPPPTSSAAGTGTALGAVGTPGGAANPANGTPAAGGAPTGNLATPGASSAASAGGTAPPTGSPSLTPTPDAGVALDVRLWNGSAEVQLDDRAINPGPINVPPGHHQLAALVDDQVVALADAPPNGGPVDLVVPSPLASLAIMIENQADARPQTGLTQADVVYEALAEGGITRFIALYLTGDAPVVGPVRSLRHYFAFMAEDYGADVVHIGASPEGYSWRDAMHMGHLDETYGDPGIWRVRTRPPPHNAYTDTAADRGFLQQRGWQQNHAWGPLLFSGQAPQGQLPATEIQLQFRPWAYRVDYTWDASRGHYLRNMEGSPHLDADSGEQIAPASVVIQFADVQAIPNDPKLRLDVNLVGGGGSLVVLSNGTRRDGTWSKTDPTTSTFWLDVGGNPIVLPPGPVWVEVLPLESPLSVY